jgi:hypothetical protein
MIFGTFAVIGSALSLTVAQPLAAQGARRIGGAAGAGGCVSPLPMPMGGGAGAFGAGGRGGRGRGAGSDSTARPDSSARRRPARARGCPPFFPDSLALTAAQKQQIVSLRATFAQNHATEFAQLRAIEQNARTAREGGQTDAQLRAITAQAEPIRKALREPEKQMQNQVEATLSAGQLAWMKAHSPPPRARR